MLDPAHSRSRQKRLLDALQQKNLDAIVVGLSHHVYYFSAYLPFWLHESAFVLFADGRSWLIAGDKPGRIPTTATDEVILFEAAWMSTVRQEQPAAAAEKIINLLKDRSAKRIGIDASAVTSQLALAFDGQCEAIDSALWQMRRRKDPDELELMKIAIRCTEAMYAHARRIIEPGISELRVYNELHAAAVEVADEPLSDLLGNNFTSAGGGRLPRKDCFAQAGQLYILDLGPAYRGYFSDNARTFSVDRKPTDAQMRAWRTVVDSFSIIEKMAKPGARCRDIFNAVDQQMKDAGGKGMTHHLGHGVGLQPHEFPHLNPNWDDVLIEGEVFAAEPGIYGPELDRGLRIENQYLVTADGVENLLNFPMELI